MSGFFTLLVLRYSYHISSHDQWLEESQHHPQPQPQVRVDNDPTPFSPPVLDDTKTLTESEVAALMANPLQLSSETFYNLEDEDTAPFTIEVQYGVRFEDLDETIMYEYDSLRCYLLECKRMGV